MRATAARRASKMSGSAGSPPLRRCSRYACTARRAASSRWSARTSWEVLIASSRATDSTRSRRASDSDCSACTRRVSARSFCCTAAWRCCSASVRAFSSSERAASAWPFWRRASCSCCSARWRWLSASSLCSSAVARACSVLMRWASASSRCFSASLRCSSAIVFWRSVSLKFCSASRRAVTAYSPKTSVTRVARPSTTASRRAHCSWRRRWRSFSSVSRSRCLRLCSRKTMARSNATS